MTNAEKFKTAFERKDAYRRYVRKLGLNIGEFIWLEMEAENGLKPCPFCGGKAEVQKVYGCNKYYIVCSSSKALFDDRCVLAGIGARVYDSIDAAIAAWNRRAK